MHDEPPPDQIDEAPFHTALDDRPHGEPMPTPPPEWKPDPDADDGAENERLPDGNYVGDDNIREGRVGGVIGGPHQQGGEGGGG